MALCSTELVTQDRVSRLQFAQPLKTLLPTPLLPQCWGSQGLSESDLLASQAKSFSLVRVVLLDADVTHCAATEFQQ